MIPAEGPQRVVVEFLPSSKGFGKRGIRLTHSGQQVPPQLQGRMDPVRATASFQDQVIFFLEILAEFESSRGHGQVS